MGLNNIELITDGPLEVNLAEIARTQEGPPEARAVRLADGGDRKREAWHEIVKRTQDAGADGIELNFGCPHGMSERGMGAAVGQVPEYAAMITEWVKEVATIPVMVKLTPNVADVTAVGRAAVEGGADALSLINTINSIMGVDLDTFAPKPAVERQGQPRRLLRAGGQADRAEHGRRAGRRPGDQRADQRDRRHPDLAGRGRVLAARRRRRPGLHGGHAPRLPDRRGPHRAGLKTGCEKRVRTTRRFVGRTVPRIKTWGDLDLNYKVVAQIDQAKCIHCGLCYIACEDGCHQSIRWDKVPMAEFADGRHAIRHLGRSRGHAGAGGGIVNLFTIKEDTCVGCNMCSLVCPVEGLHHDERGRHRPAADGVEPVPGRGWRPARSSRSGRRACLNDAELVHGLVGCAELAPFRVAHTTAGASGIPTEVTKQCSVMTSSSTSSRQSPGNPRRPSSGTSAA